MFDPNNLLTLTIATKVTLILPLNPTIGVRANIHLGGGGQTEFCQNGFCLWGGGGG